MNSMTVAEFTVFLEFQLLCLFPFILGSYVITLLALGTGQSNSHTHHYTSYLKQIACLTVAYGKITVNRVINRGNSYLNRLPGRGY
jgi:hypothetical protein